MIFSHTFCHDCIYQWSTTKGKCPICRKFFSAVSLQKDLIGFNMVNELEVYCVNSGCPWKNTLQNLNEHLKTCYFDSNRMPDYIKKIVCETKSDTNGNESNSFLTTRTPNDEEFASNHCLNFNTKASLKARLYNKNKALMENVLSKKKETNKRDTLYDFILKYV